MKTKHYLTPEIHEIGLKFNQILCGSKDPAIGDGGITPWITDEEDDEIILN